ncbi:MAG: DEAD/DEAH box helicase [Endomicrobium sp.]|nr:DEAD/DEAH box helicase [Endomicrobium sp.]
MTKFSELNLSHEVIKAIKDFGFLEATPIQSLAIPKMMKGIDIIAQAQTGTGKTAAFGIPILERIDTKIRVVQTLILCPTRELAIQVARELKLLSKYKNGINIVPVYGGQPIQKQIIDLSRGSQIVIGTPGRLIDHLERKTLKLCDVSIVVLDEADEMLDMGFRDDIEIILKNIPQKRQTAFFSATMPKEFLLLTKKYQYNPEIIKILDKKSTVPLIEQYYFDIKEYQKSEALKRCLDMYDPKLSIIFCNTKKRVDEVRYFLQAKGYIADALHGDMSQTQRDRVMSKFRTGAIEFLVATDVAARGIDVDNINMVFNYDIPKDDEDYVHRIGRTGRAGKTGKAYSFVSGKDVYKLKNIQKYTKVNIKKLQVPSLTDIEIAKMTVISNKVNGILKTKNIEKYINLAKTLVSDENTFLDIIAALLKIMFVGLEEKITKYYPEVDIFGNDSKTLNNQRLTPVVRNNTTMVKLFINIGKKDNIKVRDFVKIVTEKVGMNRNSIGCIKTLDNFSFMDVNKKYVNNVINTFNNKSIKTKKIYIKIAQKNQRKLNLSKKKIF